MKHLNQMVVLFVLMLSMTFTSCLSDSSSTYTPTSAGVVEVVNYMGLTYFVSANGVKIYPTSASLASVESDYSFNPSSTSMAYIAYQYDEDAATEAQTTMMLQNVVLSYAVSIDSSVEEVYEEGAVNDSVNTAPILSCNNVMSTSTSTTTGGEFYLMNDKYLLTGIKYYFYQYKHNFTLVHYSDDAEEENGVLKLYLRHSGTTESLNVTTTSVDAFNSGYPYVYLRSFDISSLLSSTDYPVNKIEIHAMVNAYSNNLEGATEKVYTVDIVNEVE